MSCLFRLNKKVTLLSLLFLFQANQCMAEPPYWGTIFFDPDIITAADPSAFESIDYSGQGSRVVYDRRTASWITINAYLFDIQWRDGLNTEAQVNPEFNNQAEAAVEAEKYGRAIGQLPHCLRVDVDAIWIHKGVNPFGGGNRSILIHTGQSALYEADGILEETLIHEASHTSLDSYHANTTGWLNAQTLDPNFISQYARDYPNREDVAESFLMWLAVRYRQDKISFNDFNTIHQTMPYRISYFDSIDCDLFPFIPDFDNDGVWDNTDNCISIANPNQDDFDQDSKGDVCDKDIDGDGLNNQVEILFGGDAYNTSDQEIVEANIENRLSKNISDSDYDGVPDDYETAAGGDTTSSTFESVLALLTVNKNVPAMGSIGLLLLGLTMLSVGAFRSKKK